jgi:tetratricopeptide (TPR) repeat protein
VVVAVAFVIRVIYAFQYRACPYCGHETMDAWYHDQWARALAEGRPFVEGAYFRAPLYPWFLGTVYWLFGTAPIVPRLVQAALGSLSCGLLFLIGRRTFNRPVGVIAGFTGATYWVLVYFDGELLIEVLSVFLDLLLLYLLLRAANGHRWWLWLACGVVLGLSAIARPNVLLFAPVVTAWVLVIHRAAWRRALGYALVFAAGCAAPIAPITVRNYVVSGDLVLIASQGGVNFYIGNNPRADGLWNAPPGAPTDFTGWVRFMDEEAQQAVGRPLRPSEVSDYYYGQAWRWIRENPGQVAALLVRKLGLFWSHWEFSNNKDIYFVTSRYTPIVGYLPMGFWIVGPLGVLGWVLTLREAKRLFPLWAFVAVYMMSVVVFFMADRFRLPVVAALIVLAAYAAWWLATVLRSRRRRSLALAVPVLALMTPVVARVPPGADVDMVQGRRATGLVLAQQGRLAEAQTLLAESAALDPNEARTWYALGYVQMGLIEYAQAEASFRRALQIDPRYPGGHNELGTALAAQGRFTEAAAQFRTALEAEPDATGLVRANLGAALIQAGETDEGLTFLLEACQVNAANAETVISCAQAIGRQGRLAETIRVLRSGLMELPESVPLLSALAWALSTCPDASFRDSEEAVRLAERAVALSSGRDVAALEALAAAYYAAGRVPDAVARGRQAEALAKQQGRNELAERIRRRVQRYEAAGESGP